MTHILNPSYPRRVKAHFPPKNYNKEVPFNAVIVFFLHVQLNCAVDSLYIISCPELVEYLVRNHNVIMYQSSYYKCTFERVNNLLHIRFQYMS